jgi:hypothetical protein
LAPALSSVVAPLPASPLVPAELAPPVACDPALPAAPLASAGDPLSLELHALGIDQAKSGVHHTSERRRSFVKVEVNMTGAAKQDSDPRPGTAWPLRMRAEKNGPRLTATHTSTVTCARSDLL